MAKWLTTLSVLALVQLLTMPTIGAQAVRNVRERSVNTEQIEQLQQWLERDTQEVAALTELATELAANAGDIAAARLASLRDSLVEVVQRELAQTKERGEFAKTQLSKAHASFAASAATFASRATPSTTTRVWPRSICGGIPSIEVTTDGTAKTTWRTSRPSAAHGQPLGAVLAQLTAARSEAADAPASPVKLQGTLQTAAVTIDEVLVADLEASTTELQELVKELEEERRGDRRQRRRP